MNERWEEEAVLYSRIGAGSRKLGKGRGKKAKGQEYRCQPRDN